MIKDDNIYVARSAHTCLFKVWFQGNYSIFTVITQLVITWDSIKCHVYITLAKVHNGLIDITTIS